MATEDFNSDEEFMKALMEAMLSPVREPLARFEVAEVFCTPDEVTHLLVSAAHMAYLVGLAHGRGIDLNDVDTSNYYEYRSMTFEVKQAVDRHQAENPAGFC